MKVEIELDVPEGYKIVDYRPPREGEYFLHHGRPIKAPENFITSRLIIEKTIPHRRVFECVSETPRKPEVNEYIEAKGSLIIVQYREQYTSEYRIWKEVFE